MTDGSAVILVVALAAAISTSAQQPPDKTDDGRARSEAAVIESMSGHHHMHDDPHLQLTPKWPERPGDRERATAIAAKLKAALERYRDYHVAEQNGYEIFMPKIPQPIYHFLNYQEGFAETFRFQPDQATSLLYRKTARGYELVGAMYTAPENATETDLDARVPLSVARWHQHINICLPPRGAAADADWTKFGPEGSISTPDACAAAGGRFVPRLFGWMVHVYPFAKTLDEIFGM